MHKQELERIYHILKLGKLFTKNMDVSIPLTEFGFPNIPHFKAYNSLLLLSINTFFLTDNGKYVKSPNLLDTFISALMRNYIQYNVDHLIRSRIKNKLKKLSKIFTKIRKTKIPKILEYYFSEDFGFDRYTGTLDIKNFSGDDIESLIEFGDFIGVDNRINS